MKKKIKDLTEEEIKKICDLFDGKCQKMDCHQDMIAICPLLIGRFAWSRCVLHTREYKKMNEEVEV